MSTNSCLLIGGMKRCPCVGNYTPKCLLILIHFEDGVGKNEERVSDAI